MKKLLLFLSINLLCSSLIAIKYFLVPGTSLNLIAIIFAIFAVLSHAFCFYLILSIGCIPFYLKFKYIPNFLKNLILATLFGLAQILLYADVITFEQYRFHINQSVLLLVLSGQVVEFSLVTYCIMVLSIIIVILVEFIILYFIDKTNQTKSSLTWLHCFSFFFICTLLATNLSYMIAAYYAYSPIIITKEYIPYYYPLTSKKIMGFFDKDGLQQNIRTKINFNNNVRYPIHPLMINSNKQPINILFIILDSWRYDTFNQENTPNTYHFVQQHNGVIFHNHYSTGNATRTGIFGLLYGIPGTYWESFFNNSIPSLFITTMQKENYQLGIFSSAKISAPEFDRTAFVSIENLRINSKGNTASERDKNLTTDWIKWFQHRNITQPTFSFLFYDQPHAYEFLNEIEPKYKPYTDVNYLNLNNNTDPTPIFNRYKNSVYSVDYLLQDVYSELEKSGTLDNTLIVITGDHAQEMNDNHMGFWGHNGNYTDAQTKVPFIIIGAKGMSREYLIENAQNNVLTNHEDVVPTLMKHYLAINNKINDYSTGYDLFSPITDRDWLLMSNYSTYAVRTANHIYLVNSFGMSHYLDKHNKEVMDKPNYHYLQDALNKMKYFYQQ